MQTGELQILDLTNDRVLKRISLNLWKFQIINKR